MSEGTAEGPAEHHRRKRHKPLSLRLARALDDRVGAASFTSKALGKVFPDHFSFLFGELALYSFMILVLTGTYLTFFFKPDQAKVVYHGSYRPLVGQQMTGAYQSAVKLSFDVRAGLLFRQIHHWAALVFVACIVAHLCRIFFTGAFRKPRDINWFVGVTLLVLAIANGFAGYSLLDDLLSGTGLRIAFSLMESIPFVGTSLALFVFGGPYPGTDIIGRLFVIHVLIVPAAIVGLLSVHLAMVWHQKHTQFPGPGRREDNVVGTKLWPAYAMRSISLFFAVAAVLVALGGFIQINPIWLYGPYKPAAVTTAAQPDWYMGWMEGALRLMPSGDLHVFGHTVANPFFPGVLLPGLTFAALYLWPIIERHLTHDQESHNLLERPRDRPWRTALGMTVFTFYIVLFFAGGDDVLATRFNMSVNAIVETLRVLLFVLPIVVGALTWKWCRDLKRGDDPDDAESGDVDRSRAGDIAGSPATGREPTVAPTVEGSGTREMHRDPVRTLAAEGTAIAGLGFVSYLAGRWVGRRHLRR